MVLKAMQIFVFGHGLFADSLWLTTNLGFIISTMPNMISENATMSESSVYIFGGYQNHRSNSIPVDVLHIYCLFVALWRQLCWSFGYPLGFYHL